MAPEPERPFTDITVDDDLVPAFPTDLIPPPFRGLIADVAYRMQVPADFVAVPLLVVVATAIGREFRVAPKMLDNWEDRACLWGMVIADVGAKKTPAMAEAMRPLNKLQKEMWDTYQLELGAWKRRKAAKDPDIGPEPLAERIMTSDPTVEKLALLMSGEGNLNPRGILLYRDELAGMLEAMNKYKQRGDDRQFYLQCWSGGSHTVDRIVRGTIHIDDMYLNICGTTQPGVVQKVLQGGEVDGLSARFGLMVKPALPREVRIVDQRPDYDTIRAVEERLRSIRQAVSLDNGDVLAPDSRRVKRFAAPAYNLFRDWLEENENRAERHGSDAFAAHIAKYPALFIRLALVLHFMEHGGDAPNEVSLATVESVRRLIDDYLEPHARLVYHHLGAHPARAGARRIAAWIRREQVEVFTARDIRQKDWSEFSKERDRDTIDAALNYLEAHGWVTLEERPPGVRGGRPTVEAIVNPAVHSEVPKVSGANRARPRGADEE